MGWNPPGMRRGPPRPRPFASGIQRFRPSLVASPAAHLRFRASRSQPAVYSPDDADVAWVRRVTLDGRAIPLRRQQEVRSGVTRRTQATSASSGE